MYKENRSGRKFVNFLSSNIRDMVESLTSLILSHRWQIICTEEVLMHVNSYCPARTPYSFSIWRIIPAFSMSSNVLYTVALLMVMPVREYRRSSTVKRCRLHTAVKMLNRSAVCRIPCSSIYEHSCSYALRYISSVLCGMLIWI